MARLPTMPRRELELELELELGLELVRAPLRVVEAVVVVGSVRHLPSCRRAR